LNRIRSYFSIEYCAIRLLRHSTPLLSRTQPPPLLALRGEAKKKLGDRFSLKRFYDALLSHGAPLLALIHKRVLRGTGAP
jgi:hypothetical protein